jgi:hypothetical protein
MLLKLAKIDKKWNFLNFLNFEYNRSKTVLRLKIAEKSLKISQFLPIFAHFSHIL